MICEGVKVRLCVRASQEGAAIACESRRYSRAHHDGDLFRAKTFFYALPVRQVVYVASQGASWRL